MKKLIIFDCDGTLVDSEIIASRFFPNLWKSMGVEMSEEEFICNFVGTGSNAEIVVKTKARLPPGATEMGDQLFHEELERSLEVVEGVASILPQLSQYQMCVASNSSAPYLKKVLIKTALSPFFENRVYSSRDLAQPKPAPDVFLHAARTLGFSPEETIVIEDSLSGIKAAQDAGMTVVGFMAGAHFNYKVVAQKLLDAKADYYCSSSIELRNLLLKLL